MDNHIFQSVFDILQDVLPNDWEKLVFYAGYCTGSYSIKFYVKNDNEYTDCFSLQNTNKSQLIMAFMKIDTIDLFENLDKEKEKQ